MLGEFAAMIMTRQYNSTVAIFKVFRNHVQYIIILRCLRNKKSHGGKERDDNLSDEDRKIDTLYNSYIQLVKSYIEII